jgi:hypothetical protein
MSVEAKGLALSALGVSCMDYAMPRADMLPNFEIALEEVRCKTNPIGVKGIGESGTIGASLMRWVHSATTASICPRRRAACGRRYRTRREQPKPPVP